MGWQWPWTRRHDRDLFNIGDVPMAGTYAGVSVTPDQALRHSAVWACVRLLADCVSTLPVDVYRRGDRDPLPDLPPLLRQPAAGMTLNDWLYAVMSACSPAATPTGRLSTAQAPAYCPPRSSYSPPSVSR